MGSRVINYENGNGVMAGTDNAVASGLLPNAQNFLIGHSMGGLVAREFERRGVGQANAIVTIGTPHEGAHVASNIRNGTAQTILNFGVKEMVAGPEAESKMAVTKIVGAGLFGFFGSLWVNKKIDEVVLDIYGRVEDELNEYLVGASRQATIDLSPGSAYLSDLNRVARPIAMVNIVCEENDRPALRMANANHKNPVESELHTYDDSDIIQTVNIIRDAYKGYRIYHDVMKYTRTAYYFYHNSLANKWGRGEDYLDDRLDPDYNKLIGATRSETRTHYEWVQICPDDCLDALKRESESYDITAVCAPQIDPVNCYWDYRTITYSVSVTESSDGFVNYGTQRYDPVPIGNVYFAQGVNHLEVGNHREMTRIYNQIFDRTNDVFGIPPRQ